MEELEAPRLGGAGALIYSLLRELKIFNLTRSVLLPSGHIEMSMPTHVEQNGFRFTYTMMS